MSVSQVWKLIVSSLKFCWDHITTLILLNLIWFFLWLLPMFLNSVISDNFVFFLVCMGLSLLLLGPVTAGMQYLILRLIKNEEVTVGEFISGFKKYFWRSEIIVLLAIVVLLFIVFNFSFATEYNSGWMRILSGIWLYLALFWLLIIQYIFPFLVQQDISVWLAIKRSVLLIFDNLLASLMLLLFSGLITFASLYTVVPFIILWFSMLSLMQNYIVLDLLKKYSNGRSEDQGGNS